MKRDDDIFPVDYLKSVELITDHANPEVIKLITVGISYSKKPGMPKLIPNGHYARLNREGLVELFFRIIPSEAKERQQLEFRLESVYHLGKLPAGLRGLKIIARYNSDIILFNKVI